jgi:hypothetical protein
MAFGKKKVIANDVTQENVALRAAEALAKQRAKRFFLAVRLTLESPMLLHRWSTKAINQMLGKMVGKEMPRPPKDLTQEFDESWYRNTDGVPAIPCRIVKACIVEGAIATQGVVSKAQLKRELRVRGFTAPIRNSKGKLLTAKELRMDVRIASNNGTPDVRSRAVVPEGSYFDVTLEFPPTLSPDQIMSALQGAGASIGLCDWRPDKGGEYGTFSVEALSNEHAVDRVLKECAVPEEEFEIPPELLRAFNTVPTEKLSDSARKVRSLIDHVAGQQNANGAAKRGPGRPRKDLAQASAS